MQPDCPSDERLLDFLAGRLRDVEIDTVDEHVETCTECSARIEHLEVAAARALDTHGETVDQLPDACLEMMDRAERLADRSETANTPTVSFLDGGETHTAHGGPDDEPRDSDTTVPDAAPAISLPDYEIECEIARGGMGVVFKAHQKSLNRPVALKMVLDSRLASREDLLRFRIEAEAAAKLDHPGIVPIYEIGESEGRPYFSMAFVEGGSLKDLVAAGPLDPREAARLVRMIAEAVQYAHARNVVHRDLKPANVLIDEQRQPKVTDFGLAKNFDSDSGVTRTGAVMGTPSYMAPEQADGESALVGPPADVYALGAILYYLVTGEPPFRGANVMETIRLVVEREPPPPRDRNPAVDRDLNTIVLKCLRKDPTRRYTTAAEIVDELDRYVDGTPIEARPVGAQERLWRWCQRRPALATSLGALLCTILAGLGGVAFFWWRAETERDAYANLVEDYKKISDSESEARKAADAARDLSEENELLALENLYRANLFRVERDHRNRHFGRLGASLRLLDPKPGQPDFRGWEYGFFANEADVVGQIGSVRNTEGFSHSHAFHKQADLLATRNRLGHIDVWHVSERRKLASIEAASARWLSFSHDANELYFVSNGTLHAYTIALRQSRQLLRDIECAIASPHDDTILVFRHDALPSVLSLSRNSETRLHDECPIPNRVCWNPVATDLVALLLEGSSLRFVDTRSGRTISDPERGSVHAWRAGVWSNDGRRFLVPAQDEIRIYGQRGEKIAEFRVPEVISALWESRTTVLIGTRSGRIAKLNTTDGSLTPLLGVAESRINELFRSRDSLIAVSGRVHAVDGTLAAPVGTHVDIGAGAKECSFHPKHATVGVATVEGLEVVNLDGPRRTLPGSDGRQVSSFSWHPDGQHVTVGYASGRVEHASSSDGRVEWSVDLSGRLSKQSVSWSPDGGRLAIRSEELQVFGESGNRLWSSKRCSGSLAWSGDGRVLACGIRVFDGDTGRPYDTQGTHGLTSSVSNAMWSVRNHDRCVASLGRFLVSPGIESQWFEVAPSESVRMMAMSPDGSRAVTADVDDVVLWDPSDWTPLVRIGRIPYREAQSLSWSPDGIHIALLDRDGHLFLLRGGPTRIGNRSSAEERRPGDRLELFLNQEVARSNSVDSRVRRGRHRLARGDYDGAADDLVVVLESGNLDATIAADAVLALQLCERPGQAERLARGLIARLVPDNSHEYAAVALWSGDGRTARAVLQSSVGDDRRIGWRSTALLALAEARLGNPEVAREYLRLARESRPHADGGILAERRTIADLEYDYVIRELQELHAETPALHTAALKRTSVVPDGLVAHVHFDEEQGVGVRDSVTGRLVGLTSTGSRGEGVIGGAVSVDRKEALELGQAFSPSRTEPFSISLWAKGKLTGTNPRFITTEPGGLLVTLHDRGTLKAVLIDETGWQSSDSGGRLTATEWAHFVMTYDGSGSCGGVCIYVDGGLRGRGSPQKSIGQVTAGGSLRVGEDFTGALDELRIYDRVLTDDEVRELTSEGGVEIPADTNPAFPPFAGWPHDGPEPAMVPFDAETAESHRTAWSEYLGVPGEREITLAEDVSVPLTLIPPGEFRMGISEEVQSRTAENASGYKAKILAWQTPQHEVRITQPFFIGSHEVTRGAFRRFVEETGYRTVAERTGRGEGFLSADSEDIENDPRFVWSAEAEDLGFEQTDEHPVVLVAWEDAHAFCRWLSSKDESLEFTLPTEAEWEYACRAGTERSLYFSADKYWRVFDEYAWHSKPVEVGTHPVGRLKPNAWGLHDTYGNAREWCFDRWDGKFYARSPTNDPTGPEEGDDHVVRGGGWREYGRSYIRSTFRKWANAPNGDVYTGFRVVGRFRRESFDADE